MFYQFRFDPLSLNCLLHCGIIELLVKNIEFTISKDNFNSRHTEKENLNLRIKRKNNLDVQNEKTKVRLF